MELPDSATARNRLTNNVFMTLIFEFVRFIWDNKYKTVRSIGPSHFFQKISLFLKTSQVGLRAKRSWLPIQVNGHSCIRSLIDRRRGRSEAKIIIRFRDINAIKLRILVNRRW